MWMYEEEEMADRRLGSLEKGRKKGVNQTADADATAPQISKIIYFFFVQKLFLGLEKGCKSHLNSNAAKCNHCNTFPHIFIVRAIFG